MERIKGVDKQPQQCYNKSIKGKEIKTMARLRLVKYLGQWELHNVTSGKLLASTTEETQKVLRLLALQGGHQFTLEVL